MGEKSTWTIRRTRYDHGIFLAWFCRDESEASNLVEEGLRMRRINYISVNNSISPCIQIESFSGRGYEFIGYEKISSDFFEFLDKEGCFL